MQESDKPNNRLLDIHLEEFRQLRSEIGQRIQLQHNILTFSLTLFGATLGALGGLSELGVVTEDSYFAFLVLPIVFYAFPLAFRDQDFMVSALATYINGTLRDRIASFLEQDRDALLGWEDHLRHNVDWTFLDLVRANSRYAFLFMPNIIFMAIFFILDGELDWYTIALLIVDCALLIDLLIVSILTTMRYRDISGKLPTAK